MNYLALLFIRFYQRCISPCFPASCRFTPTCSEHTYQSIKKHGMIKGSWMGMRQLCQCHPFYNKQFCEDKQ